MLWSSTLYRNNVSAKSCTFLDKAPGDMADIVLGKNLISFASQRAMWLGKPVACWPGFPIPAHVDGQSLGEVTLTPDPVPLHLAGPCDKL